LAHGIAAQLLTQSASIVLPEPFLAVVVLSIAILPMARIVEFRN
jgi:hypothetical protein